MMRILSVLFALIVCFTFGLACAEELPFCSNRIINEVTKRVGCTVGDAKCWLTKGGFCTDYVQKKLDISQIGEGLAWVPVQLDDIKKGDIAVFNYRAHYAYVESVIRNSKGKPVAVSVSEYNFGDCLVDEQTMVTEKYKVVNMRAGIPLNRVDGGFIRLSR